MVEKDKEEDYSMGMATNFGDGRLNKMEVDYTSLVDEIIPQTDSLAKEGKVYEAIDLIYPLEKQTRLGCDVKSNTRIVCHMVKLIFEGKKHDLLIETIKNLCKKRSIIKYAIKNMIKCSCDMVDKIENSDDRDQLIETLRSVTTGKIYVEVERARLTKRVADKLEKEDKLDEARTLIMELQVETYGSMEIKEKVKYLLHQMRLSIAKNDYFRAAIISRKISTKFFENDEEEDMKLEFYDYVIAIELDDANYLEVCKHYLAVFKAPKITEDTDRTKEILKRIVLYILLSKYDNERSNLMYHIQQIPQLELIPQYKALLDLFIREEMIFWKDIIISKYESLLRTEDNALKSRWKFIGKSVFSMDDEGNKRFKLFHECVGEHNVRLVAKYYTRISFDRMANLLEFTVEEMETFVCKIIADGVISDVKIHRPSQTINLKARKANIDTLEQWGSNVRSLTDMLNKVSHLILKEEMVHGVRIQT